MLYISGDNINRRTNYVTLHVATEDVGECEGACVCVAPGQYLQQRGGSRAEK
jgi:hypothetical protein